MSRIGKLPIEIPQGVDVKIEGQTVTAKGPLGTEVVEVRPEISVKVENNQIILAVTNDERKTNALHGLSRTLDLKKNLKFMVWVSVQIWMEKI